MNIKNELAELYSLKHILRYNNLPRIINESVAEHSYFVALITARLHKTYKFNLEKALLTAITHDIFEIFISDIPRNVKNKFKEVGAVLEKAENTIISEKFPEYKTLIENFNDKSTIEGLVVKYADALSVLQYSDTEIKLGSTYYMPEVKQAALNEINKIEKKLEVYKR